MTRFVGLAICAAVMAGFGSCEGEALRIYHERASDDAVELVYALRGGQELGDADVDEDDGTVTVTLHGEACGLGCSYDDREVLACLRLPLDEPLGSRELIDGATGEAPETIPPGRPPPREVPCEPPP